MRLRSKPLFSNRFFWLGMVIPAVLLGIIYSKGIAYMVYKWSADENYGHGFFVPLISLALLWQRRQRLREMSPQGSWWGIPVLLVGVAFYLVGELTTLYVLVHLSLWIVLIGLTLAALGREGTRAIAFPIFYLLAMIPLPDFINQGLSGRLQLVSSALGVGCLQWVGVTAFREGNVIDLGPIQLQVVEACSGLRYLFPLATFALLCAYLFKDRFWKRAVLFLSSLPIAVFLNGFRIGMTGVLVELYGKRTAEGFFHSFSGWLLFMVCLSLLFGEMWLLSRIGVGGKPRPFREWFGKSADSPGKGSTRSEGPPRRFAIPALSAPTYLFSLALLVPVLLLSFQLEAREEIVPPRLFFSDFPMRVAGWKGKPLVMDQAYREALRFDDYLLANYQQPGDPPVNLYAAYYRSQKKGQSAHSPRTCIPGGGWEITSLKEMQIDGPAAGKEALQVNRVLIQKGQERQVVFYWFQQRGRMLTNEYLVKFYLLWDALMKNRTDGALVRLTVPLPAGSDDAAADQKLMQFAKTVRPLLDRYIPE
ncbi:MAG: VPLPA-CTERM-specific exosortase XrtD [Nitrospirae bacterium]|nr:VPLPA-CTERM-specific exosortase XrtD [Candidatus Manganitrophaceae bacterium]